MKIALVFVLGLVVGGLSAKLNSATAAAPKYDCFNLKQPLVQKEGVSELNNRAATGWELMFVHDNSTFVCMVKRK